ncbi:MAG: hypothetical protein QM736_18160 [Vicinamibacterales bacterium]
MAPRPGTDLVVELHMQPSGREEPVQPTIGFYFTDNQPTERPRCCASDTRRWTSLLVENYVITDSFVTPVDIEVQAVQPHAHYRAKEMVGFANLPDGSVRPLDPHSQLGIPPGSTSTATSRHLAAEGDASPDALHVRQLAPRTRAIRRSRRRVSSGDSDRPTRWAICGFRC